MAEYETPIGETISMTDVWWARGGTGSRMTIVTQYRGVAGVKLFAGDYQRDGRWHVFCGQHLATTINGVPYAGPDLTRMILERMCPAWGAEQDEMIGMSRINWDGREMDYIAYSVRLETTDDGALSTLVVGRVC